MVGLLHELDPWSATSHYLNQCWHIVSLTLCKKTSMTSESKYRYFKEMHSKVADKLACTWCWRFCPGVQWVNSSLPSAAYMRQWTDYSFVQVMACHLIGAKPLPEPMPTLSIGPLGTNFSEIQIKMQNFPFRKMNLKLLSGKWQPFCPGKDELALIDYDELALIDMGPIWGRQDPDGPHVGPMNFAIWVPIHPVQFILVSSGYSQLLRVFD